jgi:hypothetical protein
LQVKDNTIKAERGLSPSPCFSKKNRSKIVVKYPKCEFPFDEERDEFYNLF